jgi:hypothetical protein
MKTLLIAAIAFALCSSAHATPTKTVGPFRIGSGTSPPPKPGKFGASVTDPGLQVDWREACYSKDGSARYLVVYSTTGNTELQTALLVQDIACTKITKASDQSVVYTTTGGTDPVCTTTSGVITRVNGLVSSGAASGKLNLTQILLEYLRWTASIGHYGPRAL